MSTWDGGFSPAQSFHPEFGYLCPSARLRRKVRGVVITLAAGTVIAGSIALALLPQLAPQPPGDGARQPSVPQAALPATALPPLDQAADLRATKVADQVVPAATLAWAVATEHAAASRAQATCDDLSGAFLAPQCQLRKAGKSHSTHAARAPRDAGSRVATVTIGRADAAAQAGPPEAAPRDAGPQELGSHTALRPAPAAEAAATVVATNEVPAVVMPPSKPVVPAKKPVKIAQKQAPSRDSADNPAAPPSPGFNLFALFHQPPRTGNGSWAMQ
jgi:hypothetical protein